MPPPVQNHIFISYSHKDQRWRDEIETQLKPYLRDGSVISWSDKQVSPGSQWFTEIKSALTNTKVAVLLVTPDFLASDFIHEHELGPLLKQAERDGVKILWVPVHDRAYMETALKSYQAAIDPNKPLATWPRAKRIQLWVKICKEIKKAVNPAEDVFSPAVIAAPFAEEAPRNQTNDENSPKTQAVPLADADNNLLSLSATLELPSDELTKQRIIFALQRAQTGNLPACTVGLERLALELDLLSIWEFDNRDKTKTIAKAFNMFFENKAIRKAYIDCGPERIIDSLNHFLAHFVTRGKAISNALDYEHLDIFIRQPHLQYSIRAMVIEAEMNSLLETLGIARCDIVRRLTKNHPSLDEFGPAFVQKHFYPNLLFKLVMNRPEDADELIQKGCFFTSFWKVGLA